MLFVSMVAFVTIIIGLINNSSFELYRFLCWTICFVLVDVEHCYFVCIIIIKIIIIIHGF